MLHKLNKSKDGSNQREFLSCVLAKLAGNGGGITTSSACARNTTWTKIVIAAFVDFARRFS